MKNLQGYHYAWLIAHPDRTSLWLSEKLCEGFHVHHMDGQHSNDAPDNLVLIEAGDHYRLHGILRCVPMTSERARTMANAREAAKTKEVRIASAKHASNTRWRRLRAEKRAARIASGT